MMTKGKTKNKKLLKLWNRFDNRSRLFPRAKSDGLSDILIDFTLPDANLAGAMQTYIFYGKYSDERRNIDPKDLIKEAIVDHQKILLRLRKFKPNKEDAVSWEYAIEFVVESIKIAKAVLKEKR
jgi:hypothetical protein